MKTLIALFLCLTLQAHALEKYVALSMIETGVNDRPPGTDLSRYGISPPVWREFSKLPPSAATNPVTALNVAHSIMEQRCARFRKGHGRAATDVEAYVLWHRPAEIGHPKARTLERAQRFANLCSIK